jgi:cytochrome c553
VRASGAWAIALACLAASAAAAQSPAEVDYALQCRGCHGADGAGVAGQVPSLAGVAALLATPGGRARLLSVAGVRQASLSDERLAALLEWVAVRFAEPGPPPRFAPLTGAEVATLRSPRSGDRSGDVH